MSQQSMGQAARRPALDGQAAGRRECVDRERRRERLAIAALTALGDRNRAVRGAKAARQGGAASDDRRRGPIGPRGRRQCGSGITVREVTRLRRVADQRPVGGTR